ncbi:MAG: hypothetical protein LBH45_02790 [Campylobacteraceae bacterium]|nr:hypothetical protein [Campylobacteraceae bacterium]
MKEFILFAFERYGDIFMYIHVVGVTMLLGALFAIRFLFYSPVEKAISDDEERYILYMRLLKRFFIFALAALFIIMIVSIFLAVGLHFRNDNPTYGAMMHIKEAVWIFIVFNMIYIYKKYKNALKAFEKNLLIETHENIMLIVKYLIPIILFFGLVAVFFGNIIRGW